MLGYNTIEKFLNRIYESQNKTINPQFISIWVREILITNPDQTELDEAQAQICQDKNFMLRISVVQQLLEKIKKNRRNKIFKKKYLTNL